MDRFIEELIERVKSSNVFKKEQEKFGS